MVIPAQEQEFKASLGYVKLCLKRLKARGYSVVNPSTHVRWLTWTLTPAPGRWTSTGPALIDTPHHNTHIGGGVNTRLLCVTVLAILELWTKLA